MSHSDMYQTGITRLQAIRDIRSYMGIQNHFAGNQLMDGRTVTYSIIVRKNGDRAEALIDCAIMRKTMKVPNLTAKQVLAYIRRWYPR